MLTELQLRNFRCFDAINVSLGEGFTFFIGNNGEGKTSVLEAACVLLRLQSQRSATLAPLISLGRQGFAVRGKVDDHRLEFRYSALHRKLQIDDAAQRNSAEYLQFGRVVSLSNTDIELVRGSAEPRRRYLDFLGLQIEPTYRSSLRGYERALRSRNALLRSAQPRPRELAAYDAPLIEHGRRLGELRASISGRLAPFVSAAHLEISQTREKINVYFAPGHGPDFAVDLAASREKEARLRQTVVGPHRDDVDLFVDGMPAAGYASEGQQRTLALALKVAQARVLAEDLSVPLLLIDDIFGELDPGRRNALFSALPNESQKLVTATSLQWRKDVPGEVYQLSDHGLQRVTN